MLEAQTAVWWAQTAADGLKQQPVGSNRSRWAKTVVWWAQTAAGRLKQLSGGRGQPRLHPKEILQQTSYVRRGLLSNKNLFNYGAACIILLLSDADNVAVFFRN